MNLFNTIFWNKKISAANLFPENIWTNVIAASLLQPF